VVDWIKKVGDSREWEAVIATFVVILVFGFDNLDTFENEAVVARNGYNQCTRKFDGYTTIN